MYRDPDVYYGLAQLVNDEVQTRNNNGSGSQNNLAEVGDNRMAQTEADGDEVAMGGELGDVTEMLGQLDTNELNELSDMLQGVNDGLNLAQTTD